MKKIINKIENLDPFVIGMFLLLLSMIVFAITILFT